jgi:hypothetical protein
LCSNRLSVNNHLSQKSLGVSLIYKDDRNWALFILTLLLFLAASLLWGYIAANAAPVGPDVFAEAALAQLESKKKSQPSTTASQSNPVIGPELARDFLNRTFLVTQVSEDQFVITPRDGGFLSGTITMAGQDARNMGFMTAVSGVNSSALVNPEPSSVVLFITGAVTLWLVLRRRPRQPAPEPRPGSI